MEQTARTKRRVALEHQVFEISVYRSGGYESSSLSFRNQNNINENAANNVQGEITDEALKKELLEGMESEVEEDNEENCSGSSSFFEEQKLGENNIKDQEILIGESSSEGQIQNSKEHEDFSDREKPSSQGSEPKEVKRKIIHKDMKNNRRKENFKLQEVKKEDGVEMKLVEEEIFFPNELQRKKAVQLYERGVLVKQICQQLEIHSKDLDNWIESTNDSRLNSQSKQYVEQIINLLKNSSEYFRLKTQKQARELYQSGMKLQEISRKMSISYSKLYSWKKQFKWNLKLGKRPQPKKLSLSSDIRMLETRKLKNIGLSAIEISQKLNVPKPTIYVWLRITKNMTIQTLAKQQERIKQLTKKREEKKSKVKRKWHNQRKYEGVFKERVIKQFYRQDKNMSSFARRRRIPFSTVYSWITNDQKSKSRELVNYEQDKQLSIFLMNSFKNGSVVEYEDIRKCMSLIGHRALGKPESWIDSYIEQHSLNSYFKIVKKTELKEENE